MEKGRETNNPLFNLILLKTYDKEQEIPYISQVTDDFNVNQLQRASSEINNRWYIAADRPIKSHRRFVGKYVVLMKKIIRKFVFRWYMNPITESQTKFNSSITNAMNEAIKYISKNEETIHQLQVEIESLKQEVQRLSDEKSKSQEG